MPVFIYEEDAFEKMSAVELHDATWLEQQKDGRMGDYIFQVFLDEYNRAWKDKNCEDGDGGIHAGDASTIYGAGGWNRYTVRLNGEIMFIRRQSRSPEDETRAADQGFRFF